MDEDVVITLVAKNPQAPKNRVRFDHTKGEFVEMKLVERMIDHLNIESTCIHKDSEEGKKQLQVEEGSKAEGEDWMISRFNVTFYGKSILP